MIYVIVVVAIVILVSFIKTVQIVPQAQNRVVERLGRYHATLEPGLRIVIPFIDRVLPPVSLKEQVLNFQPVQGITSDNVSAHSDYVIYATITDPKRSTYEIDDPILAIEQLTATTLRNVVGSMTLEEALTGRDTISAALRTVLDEATGNWGIRVNRVEIKAIEPPASVLSSMEAQMRAEREKRAAILTSEGQKQSQILTAEGQKQSSILKAQGDQESDILKAEADRQSAILRAAGEAEAIEKLNAALAENDSTDMLKYRFINTIPEMANKEGNSTFFVPAEFTRLLDGFNNALSENKEETRSANGRPPLPEQS